MKKNNIYILLLSLLSATVVYSQPIVKIEPLITSNRSAVLLINQPDYEPITSNYSTLPSGIFKSGIIFLADQLERNVDPAEKKKSTIVTSFATLDDLAETSAFGRLVGEHLMHELQIRGWAVNDIRLTSDIIINQSGEFTLSRDIKRLRGVVPAANVVTGSYTTSADGVLLSVRVIDFTTGQLTSSAETRFKLDAFMASLIYKPRPVPVVKLTN